MREPTFGDLERAIARAWAAFYRYENKVDFESPQDDQDRLYRPYRLARRRAEEIGQALGDRSWESLP
jgi:hypothetical protein